MADSITLRSHLIGSLNDLVEDAGLAEGGRCSVICELVTLFVDYKEEGTPLFLDVFVTEDVEQLTSSIPQSSHMRLGSCQLSEAGVVEAVKKTAPLVRGCWKMYLARSPQGFDYGLFRDSGHPLNVPLELALPSGAGGDTKFIRVTKLAEDTVRVSTHRGANTVVHFTNSKEGIEGFEDALGNLATMICSNVSGHKGESTRTYLNHLLSKAARESHGLIIAVVERRVPAFLRDCIRLNPPIAISDVVESVRQDPAFLPQLQAIESLILGMFASDGIVVFDTKGSLLAYNAFIKLRASTASGGARRRAFQALSDKIDDGLKAVFFQSVDGGSGFRRSVS